MKNLILIASIIAPTSSMITMETPYAKMLNQITQASQGKPSITLINNNQFPLNVKAGNLIKDDKTNSINLRTGTQLTLSLYAYPFYLDEKQIKNGAIIQLGIVAQRPYYLNLHIGGESIVKFGDTIRIKYDQNNNKIYIVHNEKKILETLHTSDDPINLGLLKTTKSSKKSSFLKKSKSMS